MPGGGISPYGAATEKPQRIIFMASRHAAYQGLSQAAQRHFAMFEVSLLEHSSTGDIPDDSVRLVLVGHDEGWISANGVRECRRRFPAAAIGLMVERSMRDIDSTILEDRLVEGILPMTLPLDVWLAVASLLVAGGEYLAHDELPLRDKALRDIRPSAEPPPAEGSAGRNLRGTAQMSAPGIETLTARERQILQLVSEGYQNKLIADRMALSEHTVKAHVHNLIAKLRVTNRTQAAAAFLQDHGGR